MTTENSNWEKEFLQADFVDQRLKTRFFQIMDAFAAAPEKSTWQQPAPEALQKQYTVSLAMQIYPEKKYWTVYPGQL